MNYIFAKRLFPSCVILPVLFVLLYVPVTYSEVDPGAGVFMDMESATKALNSNVAKIQRSVVHIITFDDAGGFVGRGSGIFIDAEGRIITNARLLKNAYSADVFSFSRYYKNVLVLNRNDDLDLALIQVEAVKETPIEFDYDYRAKPGSRVITVGRDSNLRPTVSEGLVTSVSNIGEVSNIMEIEVFSQLLSAFRLSHDGCVVNMDGKAVGIVALPAEYAADDEMSIVYYGGRLNAVSILSIKPLLEGQHSVEQLHPARTKIWHKWIVRKIKTVIASIFVSLFILGFTKIVVFLFAGVIFLALIQKYYFKLKKKYAGK